MTGQTPPPRILQLVTAVPVMHVWTSGQQLEENSSCALNVLFSAIELTDIVFRPVHVGRGVDVF